MSTFPASSLSFGGGLSLLFVLAYLVIYFWALGHCLITKGSAFRQIGRKKWHWALAMVVLSGTIGLFVAFYYLWKVRPALRQDTLA